MNNQEKLYIESKNGKIFKNLYNKIISRENIIISLKELRTNDGSKTSGVDNKDISYLEKMEIDDLINMVRGKLKNYKPKAVRRVMIPKPNGKERPLGIPCIEDRLIQMCILRVLEPICEGKFNERSYGFRIDRSCHDAVGRIRSLIDKGTNYYNIDVDIEGFFDNVNHNILIRKIWSIGIRDKKIISIIKKILKSEILGEGIPSKGTPQGGIISPLLANIYLHDLDEWITSQWENFPTKRKYSAKNKTHRALRKTSKLKEMWYVRYADDFKILCKDKPTANKILIATKEWLKTNLDLNISEEKTKIVNVTKKHSEYLGFKFKVTKNKTKKGRQSLDLRISDKNLKRIQNTYIKRINGLLYEPREHRILLLNSFILGTHNYYKIASNIGHDLIKAYLIGLKKIRRYVKTGVLQRQYVIKDEMYKKKFKRYRFKAYGYKEVVIYQIAGITGVLSHARKDGINPYEKEKIVPIKLFSGPGNGLYYSYRIGKYYQQKGKCYITGEQLGEFECHHKIPKQKGGTDDYKNLVIISKKLHIELHRKTPPSELKLDKKNERKYIKLLEMIEG